MFHVLRAILVLEYNVQPVNPPANGDNGMAECCTKAFTISTSHFTFTFFLIALVVIGSHSF